MAVALKLRQQLAVAFDPELLVTNMPFADLDRVLGGFGGSWHVKFLG
jgi:hypothetical protein